MLAVLADDNVERVAVIRRITATAAIPDHALVDRLTDPLIPDQQAVLVARDQDRGVRSSVRMIAIA